MGHDVRWVHVSELEDPTAWLEGGELLLTTGLGVGDTRAPGGHVARLAKHGLAALGFELGFGFDDVPAAVVAEADRLGRCSPSPTTSRSSRSRRRPPRLANEELERLTDALAVHERLSAAVLDGAGIQALLGIVCDRLGCSLALADADGRTLGERHAGAALSFEGALELPVTAHGGGRC